MDVVRKNLQAVGVNEGNADGSGRSVVTTLNWDIRKT